MGRSIWIQVRVGRGRRTFTSLRVGGAGTSSLRGHMIRGICGVPALFLGLVVVLVPAERPAIASSGPSFNIVATAPTRTSQIRLSADGSTVAFTDTSTGDELPFRWRPDTG